MVLRCGTAARPRLLADAWGHETGANCPDPKVHEFFALNRAGVLTGAGAGEEGRGGEGRSRHRDGGEDSGAKHAGDVNTSERRD
eukprot:1806308-Rhodomonas_salina.3